MFSSWGQASVVSLLLPRLTSCHPQGCTWRSSQKGIREGLGRGPLLMPNGAPRPQAEKAEAPGRAHLEMVSLRWGPGRSKADPDSRFPVAAPQEPNNSLSLYSVHHGCCSFVVATATALSGPPSPPQRAAAHLRPCVLRPSTACLERAPATLTPDADDQPDVDAGHDWTLPSGPRFKLQLDPRLT